MDLHINKANIFLLISVIIFHSSHSLDISRERELMVNKTSQSGENMPMELT